MIKPQRIRLSRRAGFKLQEASLALNGLPAIMVSRPTRWGNPFKIGDLCHKGPAYSGRTFKIEDAAMACKLFEAHMFNQRSASELIFPLRGKNLACWCALDQPCHADILIKLANQGKD